MSDDERFMNVIKAEFGAGAARRSEAAVDPWGAAARRVAAEDRLKRAISDFNASERRGLAEETGLTWLGDGGPVYRAGNVLIRGLFVDRDGGHWCDAGLVVESAYTGQPGAVDHFLDRIGGGDIDPAHELLVHTNSRGRYTAFIVPVEDVVGLLELGEPVLTREQWARCWETFPSATDRSELELLRHGLAVPGLIL